MAFVSVELVYLCLGAVLVGLSLLGLVLRLAQQQGMATWVSRALSLMALAVGVLLVVVNWLAPTPNNMLAPIPNTVSSPPVGQFRGTVNEVVNGDLMCYVTFTNQEGRFTVGASFDVCDPQWVGQAVNFTVAPGRVSDCESAEPCGQTQDVLLIVGISKVS